jgi:hypothetical protein
MILFPLMICWVWFQIFTASQLHRSFSRLRPWRTCPNADVLSVISQEAKHDPGLFSLLQLSRSFG